MSSDSKILGFQILDKVLDEFLFGNIYDNDKASWINFEGSFIIKS